jgi:hypothetical protein
MVGTAGTGFFYFFFFLFFFSVSFFLFFFVFFVLRLTSVSEYCVCPGRGCVLCYIAFTGTRAGGLRGGSKRADYATGFEISLVSPTPFSVGGGGGFCQSNEWMRAYAAAPLPPIHIHVEVPSIDGRTSGSLRRTRRKKRGGGKSPRRWSSHGESGGKEEETGGGGVGTGESGGPEVGRRRERVEMESESTSVSTRSSS